MNFNGGAYATTGTIRLSGERDIFHSVASCRALLENHDTDVHSWEDFHAKVSTALCIHWPPAAVVRKKLLLLPNVKPRVSPA